MPERFNAFSSPHCIHLQPPCQQLCLQLHGLFLSHPKPDSLPTSLQKLNSSVPTFSPFTSMPALTVSRSLTVVYPGVLLYGAHVPALLCLHQHPIWCECPFYHHQLSPLDSLEWPYCLVRSSSSQHEVPTHRLPATFSFPS